MVGVMWRWPSQADGPDSYRLLRTQCGEGNEVIVINYRAFVGAQRTSEAEHADL